MANTSSDFIKINNEYVKFYATTNTALPDILKNTGALIVVQDNDKVDELGEHIRSLYIAKNFVAEGHGFSAETVRDYYDSYGEMVTWIDGDGDEVSQRTLSYILDGLQGGINTNAKNMENYVLIQGGDITNTYVDASINGNNDDIYKLKSKYIINLLKPYDYKDATIDYVTSYIKYKYNVGNFNVDDTEFISYANNSDILDYNNKYINRTLEYDVPRGAQLTYAYMYMEATNNSTGGFTSTTSGNNTTENPDAEHSTLVINSTIGTGENNKVIVKDDNNVSYVFTGNNMGTLPGQIKKYPWLPSNVNFYSYENVIPEYTVNIAGIKLNIYDTVKSYICNSDAGVDPKYINSYVNRIYENENDCAYVTMTCGTLPSKAYLYFSVPEKYETVHVHQLRQYKRNNIETSYYEYNVTGDVYELKRNTNKYLTYHTVASKQQYYKSRNYCLKNKLASGDIVKLTLKKNYAFTGESIEYKSTSLTSENCITTAYFLQDSEYNSNHWMSPVELSYIQNVI